MSSRAGLDGYLDEVRNGLRRVLYARGVAVALGGLLLLTLLAALWLGRSGFAPGVVVAMRLAGIAVLAASAGATAWALHRRFARGGAAVLEQVLPGQDGRIDTYLQERAREAAGDASPLIDLLAEDAWHVAARTSVAEAVPARRWVLPAALAVAAASLLVALVAAGPGLWGEGARRVWLGVSPPAQRLAQAAGGIAVQPGDATVRRNQDLAVSAQVQGGGEVRLHMRSGADGEWDSQPMQPDGRGGYAGTLYALRDAASYYVSAGRLQSAEHRVEVVDLPRVQSLRVSYRYPAWSGLAPRVDEVGGDVRAVEGTQVALEVTTDSPLSPALLVVNGSEGNLEQSGTRASGGFTIGEAGHYRIATRFGDEVVALTEDFHIDVVPDEKPQVQIVKPGRDYQATPIEEVPVDVRAQDDFRLEALALHYSVNGGPWREEKLDAGVADVQAAVLLRLEEMQQAGADGDDPLLVPGDLVSYYAVARDHRHTVQTDLFLVQVQPFDRRFTQSQGGGGGGGGEGGDDEGAISQRQREVLLATWNLQRAGDTADPRELERRADSARMLSGMQGTLADQVSTLVERTRARLLAGADERISRFVESLVEAEKAMRPAVESLDGGELADAVGHEQRALQQLLRAESTFRDIQVAMQQGGGGGGGGQAGRDVAEMTELELDLDKNQYESEPQMTAQQRSQAEDETLRQLRELARRQEQLAREANRNQAQPEAQRWQQEQLRREAEQLRQQLEQLARRQDQQGQQGQQSGQEGGAQGDASSPTLRAAQQVAQALRDMQSTDPARARAAAEQLERARQQLERARQQQSSDAFEQLAQSAGALLDEQRRAAEALRASVTPRPPSALANPGAGFGESELDFERADELAAQKRALQAQLEALQAQMREARQQGRERAPEASRGVARESSALDEAGIAAGLARSALELERGLGTQAAVRDELITQALQGLEQGLREAADLAAAENARTRSGQQQVDAGVLLAELGDLRRTLEQVGGQQGGDAPQEGGGGGQAGTRGGDPGGRQLQAGGERLGRLQRDLVPGALPGRDEQALRELAERMRGAGNDPMNAEYPRMIALVDQLELAALRAQRGGDGTGAGRADVVDDPGPYRENVAEYYRRLGGVSGR